MREGVRGADPASQGKKDGMILIDQTMSRKLERTEATANRAFVEARARLQPDLEASWIELGGTFAMYDGIDSPCTQTFGLGLFTMPDEAQLGEIERFFLDRKAGVYHEVSPLADASVLPLLNGRGYRPIELSSVLCRDISAQRDPSGRRNVSITTRVIDGSEVDLWARTSAAGWVTEHESLADFMFGFGRISASCEGSSPFLAEFEQQPIAAGMLFIHGDVAMLAGASTIPDARNRGAQNALLYDRLKFAAERGCTLASMAALPGGQSQINAQKNGFQIAYTRTKWELNR